MVKGITRQVIVVHSPGEEIFDQAIFILNENAVGEGVTEEILLKEARQAIRGYNKTGKKRYFYLYGAVWASAGAILTGMIWLLTAVL